MNDRQKARQLIAAFIKVERRWRERVFMDNPVKMRAKVDECDRALAALDILEPPTQETSAPTLFEMEE